MGKDPFGCEDYACRPKPCPRIKMPPMARITRVKVDENGCLQFEWKFQCLNFHILGCKLPTVQKEVGRDENGCAKYDCVPCPMPKIKCVPPMMMLPVGEAPAGEECPPFDCIDPSKKQLKGKKEKKKTKSENKETEKENEKNKSENTKNKEN